MGAADAAAYLIEEAVAINLLADAESGEAALRRARRLPLVHKLKADGWPEIESVLSVGLRSAAQRGETRFSWRARAGTQDDVFCALGALTYPPSRGPILLLRPPPRELRAARTTPWGGGPVLPGAPRRRVLRRSHEVAKPTSLPYRSSGSAGEHWQPRWLDARDQGAHRHQGRTLPARRGRHVVAGPVKPGRPGSSSDRGRRAVDRRSLRR